MSCRLLLSQSNNSICSKRFPLVGLVYGQTCSGGPQKKGTIFLEEFRPADLALSISASLLHLPFSEVILSILTSFASLAGPPCANAVTH